jgi:NADPH:quinone reductase-like Zn-dependent oxidoreductase
MPQQIRAVVVDPAVPGRLAIREVGLRDPDRDEVGVRVTAISLNRGETRRALQAAEWAGAPAGISPGSSKRLPATVVAPKQALKSSASCPREPGQSA